MKQFLQNLSTGLSEVIEIPTPTIQEGKILIRTRCSLLSSGTERMIVNFAKSNLINKAKQQPDKVKEVLDKVKTDGLINTFEAVNAKLKQPISLGYSNVGEIIEIGKNVEGFKVGDRVISNAPHAEIVLVPKNLCCVIPEEVNDDSAVFTVLASIGLQGIRLANPTLGETFLVSGLGLIGLLTAQLLKSQNCRVLGIDPDPDKCDMAGFLGIENMCIGSNNDVIKWCMNKTNGIGVDGALITASTSSSEPIDLAANILRKRGRIILIGKTGCDLNRELFYKKELTFQVSCSYGPGRYDVDYEEKGQDYPIGFVRWTEKRNFEAVLATLSKGLIKVNDLISKRYAIEDAPLAYSELLNNQKSLGILFEYKNQNNQLLERTIRFNSNKNDNNSSDLEKTLGFIGAGNYAGRILLPNFKNAGAKIDCIVSSTGLSSFYLARKYKLNKASTEVDEILNNPKINGVVIATRHNSHADLIIKCIKADKHVFVEKPLCINSKELDEIKSIYSGKKVLMVGFNRRFSPLVLKLKNYISKTDAPKAFIYTCNAGSISKDHWIQDPLVGGGRLIGEACHFVDLLRFLANSKIVDISLNNIHDNKGLSDTFTIEIKFMDNSIGTIHYFANGSNEYPKERIEVFVDGKVFELSNFRKLKAWGVKGFNTKRLLGQDKGQAKCAEAFLNSMKTGYEFPIPINELFEVQNSLNNLLKI